jgi:hypothetical protein
MSEETVTDQPDTQDAGEASATDTESAKSVDTLPDWAQSLITETRKEAARYRTRAKELAPFEEQAKAAEEAQKTELQKLQDELSTYKERATKAEQDAARARVAAEKGLTPAQARRLVGATEDELKADADELLSTFSAPITERPKEKLRGGSQPQAEVDITDPAKLAELVRRPAF